MIASLLSSIGLKALGWLAAAVLVREPAGNAKYVTCVFHHWTFDTKGDCGLRRVRTEVKYGMVFCNLNDGCAPLDAYLGGSMDYVKDVMGAAPLEVFS